ncbi:MAG TPA: Tim44 domain-containing protein [Syntrophorhabdales bacterium]|nr:Tim44 domain-containing protein [Syntrophorhabdales bacterium]
MEKNRWVKVAALVVTFFFLIGYVLEADSLARVGGGGSFGSRGSRSYSSPSRPSPGPSQSYGTPTRPTPPAQQPFQQPGGGGFFRSMLGGIAGGFLGSMLFRSLGWGGLGDGMGGGIGLFEIALLALVLFLLYRFIKRRREAAMTDTYYQDTGTTGSTYQQSYTPAYGPEPTYGTTGTASSEPDTEQGLSYIKQMDPYFDEQKFRDLCMDYFFKIQGAWTGRDVTSVRNLLTAEMYRTIQADVDKLRSEKKVNRLENIAVRSVKITEAWQEQGQDYITVLFYANLLDYVIDETSGQVVSGSKADPVKFEEYWTFTRNVGSNPWQLSAINQAN